MGQTLSSDLEQRLLFLRDRARAASDALAAHAQDVMMSGQELQALAQVQACRAHLDAAIIALDSALREARVRG